MTPTTLLHHLTENAGRIRLLADGLSTKQALWKPDAGSWSVLEVVNHLYDEERLDFRPHLEYALQPARKTWEPARPLEWVQAHDYNGRDPQESLENFLAERRESLRWLSALEQPDWQAAVQAPFGTIRAGDLLASWAAHDLLHMRQLVELRLALLAAEAQPFRLDYAEG